MKHYSQNYESEIHVVIDLATANFAGGFAGRCYPMKVDMVQNARACKT